MSQKRRSNQRTHSLHGVGASQAKDDQLAKTGEPLGTAVAENRKKKRSGENRPAT
jgi:hypothetical protein